MYRSRNFEIAELLNQMADLSEILGENQFKARALRNGARVIEATAEDIAELAAANRLLDINGVGEGIAKKINEYLSTGHIRELEKMMERVPKGLLDLLLVRGLGPKTAKLLYEERKIDSIDRLRQALEGGELAGLAGFGNKKIANLKRNMAFLQTSQQRMLLGYALPLAEYIISEVRRIVPEETRITYAGSLRRGRETIGDLDILVAGEGLSGLCKAFVKLPFVAREEACGDTKATITTSDNVQVDLRVLEAGQWGAGLLYFTGSKAHNVVLRGRAKDMGLRVNEYAVLRESDESVVASREEKDCYAALNLPYMEPELREDTGEFAAAETGRLPNLLRLSDMKGDLHMHTNASDGLADLVTMVDACAAKGYRYCLITDHSQSLKIAHGLEVERLLARGEEIAALNRTRTDIRVLWGTECDILTDGSLDYPDEVLARLDLVIASVHSAFGKDPTGRTIKALANPHVDIIGHPTGRVITAREAFDLDVDAVARAAAQYGKALEINSFADRLDLCDHDCRRARDLGAKIAINTDAHAPEHLEQMKLGVITARRGWLETRDVINTWDVEELMGWAKR